MTDAAIMVAIAIDPATAIFIAFAAAFARAATI